MSSPTLIGYGSRLDEGHLGALGPPLNGPTNNEANIHHPALLADKDLIYKRYRHAQDADRLTRLIRTVTALARTDNGRALLARTTFPIGLVTTPANPAQGVLLPKIPDSAFSATVGRKSRHVTIDYLCDENGPETYGLPAMGFDQRLATTASLVNIYAAIERHQLIVPDISYGNALYAPAQPNLVLVIDVDGADVRPRPDLRSHGFTETDPRNDGLADQRTMRFRVALLAWRILASTHEAPQLDQLHRPLNSSPNSPLVHVLRALLGPRHNRPPLVELRHALEQHRATTNSTPVTTRATSVPKQPRIQQPPRAAQTTAHAAGRPATTSAPAHPQRPPAANAAPKPAPKPAAANPPPAKRSAGLAPSVIAAVAMVGIAVLLVLGIADGAI